MKPFHSLPPLLEACIAPVEADASALPRTTASTDVRARVLPLLVATVIDERHPAFAQRVLVRYEDEHDHTREHWVPVVARLAVRLGDQVLLAQPANWAEPIVVSVIDGLLPRPETPRSAAHAIELREDEHVEVRDSSGRPLLHIREGEHGPVLSLARPNVDLEVAGLLRIRAHSLELAALKGALRLDATQDVVVHGEIIHLN